MALAEQLSPLKRICHLFLSPSSSFYFSVLGKYSSCTFSSQIQFVKNCRETISVELFENFFHPFILFCLSGSRGVERPIPTLIEISSPLLLSNSEVFVSLFHILKEHVQLSMKGLNIQAWSCDRGDGSNIS